MQYDIRLCRDLSTGSAVVTLPALLAYSAASWKSDGAS